MQGFLGRAKILYGRDTKFDFPYPLAATSASMQEAVS